MSKTADSERKKTNHSGQWKKGQSGNPTGRRAEKKVEDLAKMCRIYTQDALDVVYSILMNPEHKAHERLKAADMLIDRGWGRTKEIISIENESGTNPVFVLKLRRDTEEEIAERIEEDEFLDESNS